MSKFSLGQVLNFLNDMDSDESMEESTQTVVVPENMNIDITHRVTDAVGDLEDSEYSLTVLRSSNQENTQTVETETNSQNDDTMIPLNIYDTNDFPMSYVEELNGHNICMVSEKAIDVIMDIEHAHRVTNAVGASDDSEYSLTVLQSSNQESTQTLETNAVGASDNSDYSIAVLQSSNQENTQTLETNAVGASDDSDYSIAVLQSSNQTVDHMNNNNMAQGIATGHGRKRTKNQLVWEKTIRKRRRQAGEEYKSSKGKQVPKKLVNLRKNCVDNCRKKCAEMFCKEEIEHLHRNFWALSDSAKLGYFARTTGKRINKSKKENSKRKFTFLYYFHKNTEEKIPVCKEFYLGVLNISDNRIRNYYRKVDIADGNQFSDLRGRATKQRKGEEDVNILRQHIEAFPTVPSHYCRASSSKQYLDTHLSLSKMYELYKEHCKNIKKNPLKINIYRKIFNTEYNLGFHTPKKDRCDLCEEMKVADDRASPELMEKYAKHNNDKVLTKIERDVDRRNVPESQVVVSFDLENVFSLPKSNVSNFFYRRKLSTYNLTAHSSKDGCAYNCIWHEAISGRGANDIASAVVTILKDILRVHPDINSFILWSDACVPQNKNSIMSFALKRFMADCKIDSIEQKFGCPGHSAVQEVDNIHSNIERVTRYAEIYSPVGLIRALKGIRRRKPVRVIQMQKHHFWDYQKCIMPFKFNEVPFTKVKCLRYDNNLPFHIEYKLSFDEANFRTAKIDTRKTRATDDLLICLPRPAHSSKIPSVSKEKKDDITSMLKYMPDVDRQFYYKALKLINDK